MLVREVMTPDPVTVGRMTTIKEALKILAHRGFTAMPVVGDTGALYGIVSEADLITENVARDPRAQERPIIVEPLDPPHLVEEVCTRAVVTVAPADDVLTAVDLMALTGAKSLPVLDGRELVGVVSRSDIVAALARSDESIAADLQALLESLGHGRWVVTVEDGSVRISGPRGAAEHSLAHVVARTVGGVVGISVDA